MDEDLVRHLVEERNLTYQEVSEELLSSAAEEGGRAYGLSSRSVRRFCKDKGITRKMEEETLDAAVGEAVSRVGPSYGRRMMKGYLEMEGFPGVRNERLSASLRRVGPEATDARGVLARRNLNPKRYHAAYFGYNSHINQNEKLKDFGVTYVAGIDGYSSFVFNVAVMPVKNNITIYRDFFIPIVKKYGLFDRVLADGGTEFMLTLFMQQHYWSIINPERDPLSTFRQMPSTLNNRIERYWKENNERVTYPIKRALIELEQRNLADPTLPSQLHSISEVAMWVARYGAKKTADIWNHHTVNGRGKPIELAQDYGMIVIPEESFVDVEMARELYIEDGGGQLTDEHHVGIDLLEGNKVAQDRRETLMNEIAQTNFSGVENVFGRLVNGDYCPFQSLVVEHIKTSHRLQNQV